MGGGDLTVGIERVRLGSQHDFTEIRLLGLLDEAQQFGCLTDSNDEHTGGTRVERAAMANLAFVETSAEHPDDVVTCDPGWLVNHGNPVSGRWLLACHVEVPVASVGGFG